LGAGSCASRAAAALPSASSAASACAKRGPMDEIERVLTLYRDRYDGFTVKHFHEKLAKEHEFRYGYTWAKVTLQRARLVKTAPRRSAHREASGAH
jgi:hypothetical protein